MGGGMVGIKIQVFVCVCRFPINADLYSVRVVSISCSIQNYLARFGFLHSMKQLIKKC